jgi:hypothetical protein
VEVVVVGAVEVRGQDDGEDGLGDDAAGDGAEELALLRGGDVGAAAVVLLHRDLAAALELEALDVDGVGEAVLADPAGVGGDLPAVVGAHLLDRDDRALEQARGLLLDDRLEPQQGPGDPAGDAGLLL